MELVPPEYRLRLFLSVDLVGSTDFKSQKDTTNLDWLKAYQKFYGEFPKRFSIQYRELCDSVPEVTQNEIDAEPKIWKTVGDEILFVNRVYSVTHLAAYISAFIAALKEFGKEINSIYPMNTKGNGWVAAFPNPNCSIRLSGKNGTDPLNGDFELPTESFERQVDEDPHKYDFLGKGIDGGFRIAKYSTVDSFTISPGLAYLLCSAKRNRDTTKFVCDFYFHEPQKLKGVVGGKDYPIISIDTSRDDADKEVKSLQAKLLRKPDHADSETLNEYLEKYIVHNNIELPILKLSSNGPDITPPDHFVDYKNKWKLEAKKLSSVLDLEKEAGDAPPQDSEGSEFDLKPLSAVYFEKFTELAKEISRMKQPNSSTHDSDDVGE